MLDPVAPLSWAPRLLARRREHLDEALAGADDHRLSLLPCPFMVANPGFRSKPRPFGDSPGHLLGRYDLGAAATARACWTSLDPV